MEIKQLSTEKRLPVNIDSELLYDLKARALVQRITLKDWVLEAIVDKIKKDTELGWK